MPAGLIDEGEGAAQAAVRELKEETGMSVAIRSCAQFVVCCWQRAFGSNGRHCVCKLLCKDGTAVNSVACGRIFWNSHSCIRALLQRPRHDKQQYAGQGI